MLSGNLVGTVWITCLILMWQNLMIATYRLVNKRSSAIICSIIIYKTQFNFYNLSKLPPLIAQVGVGLFIHLHSSWKWQLSDFLDKYHHTSKLFNKYWKTIWLITMRSQPYYFWSGTTWIWTSVCTSCHICHVRQIHPTYHPLVSYFVHFFCPHLGRFTETNCFCRNIQTQFLLHLNQTI